MQVLSREIFKNTYFEEHLRTIASKKILIESISYLVNQLGSCTLHPSVLYGW